VFGLGITELLLILGLIVLVFGARKIPLIARGLGEGIRNFKGEMKSDDHSLDSGAEDVDRRSD
jgi:sec-independent protein translocase protein TatA